MVKKNDYHNWNKEDLIKEVEALKKKKTYGNIYGNLGGFELKTSNGHDKNTEKGYIECCRLEYIDHKKELDCKVFEWGD